MRHIIIGAGNLGLDLHITLKEKNFEVGKILSRSTNFDVLKTDLSDLKEYNPSVLWYTVGAGSVSQAKQDFLPFIGLHLKALIRLKQELPLCKIITFSTDYCADSRFPTSPNITDPNSLYAYSKAWVEDYVNFMYKENPNIHAVRIGSLYGSHFPEKTFPGRLRANFSSQQVVKLPINLATPTPTSWLAKILVENLGDIGNPVHHLAPSEPITISNWGRTILGPQYEVVDNGLDTSRPEISDLGNDISCDNPSCLYLWEKYKI